MSEETSESRAITNLTGVVTELSNDILKLKIRIEEMDERQRTIMVGWNAFLKSAEAQLKFLFKGNIPGPILKKLIQTAFKGVEDMERKNK